MSRRLTPWVALLLAMTLGMTACGDDEAATTTQAVTTTEAATTTTEAATTTTEAATTTEAPTTTAGPWTFTDDEGVTVTLDEMPTRIVAHELMANALLHFGITPVGIFGGTGLADNPQVAGFDLTGVESLGEVWGEVNLEAMAELEPDLIVMMHYPIESDGTYFGFAGMEQQQVAAEIAPIIAFHATAPASQTIERIESFVGSLGVDVNSPELAAQRDRYTAAVAGFQAAVAGNPDLTAAVVGATADALYVVPPAVCPDCQDYVEWGLNIITPDDTSLSAYYEILSWELADKYVTDLIFYDNRPYTLPPEELLTFPAWAGLPAVQAEQYGPWFTVVVSYEKYAEQLEILTELIEAADDVTP